MASFLFTNLDWPWWRINILHKHFWFSRKNMTFSSVIQWHQLFLSKVWSILWFKIEIPTVSQEFFDIEYGQPSEKYYSKNSCNDHRVLKKFDGVDIFLINLYRKKIFLWLSDSLVVISIALVPMDNLLSNKFWMSSNFHGQTEINIKIKSWRNSRQAFSNNRVKMHVFLQEEPPFLDCSGRFNFAHNTGFVDPKHIQQSRRRMKKW